MMVLITRIGIIAIPVALAVTATVEMLLQGAVLLLRLRRRIQRTPGPPARITSD
jgi:hypothetical protein